MRSHEYVTIVLLASVLVCENITGLQLKSEREDVQSIFGHNNEVTLSNCTVTESCAECSCRGLKSVPEHLPQNITCLNLRGNNIASINGTVFLRYKCLVRLSLSNNSLTMIGEDNFKTLSSLEMLDLSLNNIPYDKIDKNAFKELKLVYYLDLKQKPDTALNAAYPQSLANLKRLEYLMIDGIDSPLPFLPHLKELYLSGQYGSCVIPHLRGDIFQNISNIETIYLSNCSIQSVEIGPFQNLSYLEALDLSWNTELTFESMYNITFGLPRFNFKRLNLNNVYKYYRYGMCTSLTADDLRNLNETLVELLTIEGNDLVRFEDASVAYVPQSLRYLSVRDNMLMYGDYTDTMIKDKVLQHIVYFDNSKTFSSHMPPDFKVDIASEPRAGNTSIACSTVFTREQMKTYFEIIDDRLMKFNITPVGNNKTLTDSADHVIEYLDLSDSVPDSYKLMFKLFDSPGTLRYLNMSGTYLGYTLLDSSTLFDQFVRLTTLDIGRNGILDLKANVFDNLTRLERLYLTNNKIANITFKIHLLKSLTYLDLSFNHLEFLDKHVMESLDMLPNITVNIGENSLKCDCNQLNLHFLQWMRSTKATFETLNNTRCYFKNETPIMIPDLNFEQLKYECRLPTYPILTIDISICIIAFVIIVFGGIIYIYRWDLTYLYYRTKLKRKTNPVGYQALVTYKKKVFISYAYKDSKDSAFVTGDVRPQLERAGLSCVAKDTFSPGGDIVEMTNTAVITSQRTLVILTRAYLDCNWCMYQMRIARFEGIDTNRNNVFVVMKENIPSKMLPIAIIDIIRSNHYCDYPKSQEDRSKFWDSLKSDLEKS